MNKKLCNPLFFICMFISLTCKSEEEITPYTHLIKPHVTAWEKSCIKDLSTKELITITDALLLSYQLVEASLVLSKTKLVLQSEIFKIVTLSINDTFETTIQAQNNDTSVMKKAIYNMEEAQDHIKSACDKLKKFGPLLLHITPQVTQQFIANLKKIILAWATQQESTITNFEKVQQEFLTTSQLFSAIKNIFEEIVEDQKLEHNYLLEGTNSITTMYKKIEKTLAKLTETRLEGILKLNDLFTTFFKLHYQVLYDKLKDEENIELQAISEKKLPLPADLFPSL